MLGQRHAGGPTRETSGTYLVAPLSVCFRRSMHIATSVRSETNRCVRTMASSSWRLRQAGTPGRDSNHRIRHYVHLDASYHLCTQTVLAFFYLLLLGTPGSTLQLSTSHQPPPLTGSCCYSAVSFDLRNASPPPPPLRQKMVSGL